MIRFYIPALMFVLCAAGCAPGETPVVSGAPASDVPATAAPVAAGVPVSQPAAVVASSDPTVAAINCPQIQVRAGTEVLRSYDKTGSTDADLKYQANITNLARECSILGIEVGIKATVAGRLILGPKGKPGTYKLPVRIAVVRGAAAKPLWSKVLTVDAKIAAGEASANFTVVAEDILFPREANDALSDLQIYAGFDPAKK